MASYPATRGSLIRFGLVLLALWVVTVLVSLKSGVTPRGTALQSLCVPCGLYLGGLTAVSSDRFRTKLLATLALAGVITPLGFVISYFKHDGSALSFVPLHLPHYVVFTAMMGLSVVAGVLIWHVTAYHHSAGQASALTPEEYSSKGLPLAGTFADGSKVFSDARVREAGPAKITFADGCWVKSDGKMKLCGHTIQTTGPMGNIYMRNARVSGNSSIRIN